MAGKRMYRAPALSSLIVALAMSLYVTEGSAATITIDGSFEDWNKVPVTATDPRGDSPPFLGAITDLLSVRLTHDSKNLYALLTYAGTPFLGSLLFDTDNNPATGALGAEYGLCFRSAPVFVIVDTFAGGLCNGSPGLFVPPFAFGGTSIEAAIPLKTFLGLTPGFDGTFTFNTGGFLLDRLAHSQTFSTVPEPSSLLLFTTAAAGLIVTMRRRRKQQRQ